MADDIAVRVDKVSKDFILPHEKVNSIKGLFTGAAKRRGKRYKGGKETQHALRDISFEVKEGEFFGIVGRNGSGKSTLLKILAGIYQPTKGKVHTRGKLVPFIELGVGFNPELTGRENVYLNGALLGFSEKEVDKMYDDVVAFAELERFMDQKLKNYSSGMQVRLAFSMAVRAQADILLIDEVLAVGDADFQKKCYEYFLELKGAKKTVVFVSHDMEAVRRYCDRAILIDDSVLVVEDEAGKVSEAYTKLFDSTVNYTEYGSNLASGESERWGNRLATFTDVDIAESIKSYRPFNFKVTAEAKQDIDNVVFGFSIKNAAKEKLLGSNTEITKSYVKKLGKGEKITFTCKMPNIFSSGTHYIDVAMQTDAQGTIEYWQDAARFMVINDYNSPYQISPEIHITQKFS